MKNNSYTIKLTVGNNLVLDVSCMAVSMIVFLFITSLDFNNFENRLNTDHVGTTKNKGYIPEDPIVPY